MRALITGISGQIGWYLASLLQADGVEVWGLVPPQAGVHLTAGGEAGQVAAALPGVQVVAGDVLDPWSLLSALETARPDVVYALGAVSQPNLASALPDLLLQINSMGIVRLLEACRRVVPQAKIVHASSDCIFGDTPSVWQDETTPLTPDTGYGLSKAWAHLAIQEARARGQWAANAILFNATSPRQISGLVPYLVNQILAVASGRTHMIVVDSVDVTRDWVFAGEVATALQAITSQMEPKDTVVASGETHCVGEWLAIGLRVLGADAVIKEDPRPDWKPERRRPLTHPARLGRMGWIRRLQFHELVTWMTLTAAGQLNERRWWPAGYGWPMA